MSIRNQGNRQNRRVFAFQRVSTKEQAEGASLTEQRRVIQEFCERRSLEIVGNIEEVQTAAKTGRANFEAMVKALKKGNADGIVFHKVDRSSRNYRDWLTISDLMDSGLYIAFAAEGLESSDPSGRLTMDILAATAVHYIRNLKGEIRKGISGRIRAGLWPKPAPLGYLNPPKGTPKEKRCRKRIDPKRADLVREAFLLYATGAYTLERLTDTMRERGLTTFAGKPLSMSRITDLLDNPFYAGWVFHADQLFPGKHSPLIDHRLFERVQELRRKRMHALEYKHAHLLQQLLVCAVCQRFLTPEIQKGHTYYRCHNHGHESNAIREENVSVHISSLLERVHPSEEEKAIMAQLLGAIEAAQGDEHQSIRQRLQLETNNIKSQRQRAAEGYTKGILSEDAYKEQETRLTVAERDITQKLAKLSESSHDDIVSKAIALFERLDLAYSNAKKPEQRQLLRSIISNFSVAQKNVSIEPRKWVRVAVEREKFLLGAPPREKLRICKEFLEKLTEACLEDSLHVEAASMLASPVEAAIRPAGDSCIS